MERFWSSILFCDPSIRYMLVERRRQALLLDEHWRRDRAAHNLVGKLGYSVARKGFPKKSI